METVPRIKYEQLIVDKIFIMGGKMQCEQKSVILRTGSVLDCLLLVVVTNSLFLLAASLDKTPGTLQ